MKTTLKENVLTVVTGIKKEDFDKKVTDMTVKDDKGNMIFSVSIGETPEISNYGLVCNSTVDGELAATVVVPMGTDAEKVKVKYGKALVKASECLPKIVEQVAEDSKAIDKIFAAADK